MNFYGYNGGGLKVILFTFAVIIILIGIAHLTDRFSRDCPRMILGYKCKGSECNHSRDFIEAAKEAMRDDS